jgi:hypothetical protein
MARWTDIATWVGATSARNAGGMSNPPRGLVLHIASGFYDGTISWQKRDSGSDRTSSHFIVGRDGRCAQMVDTADASWAQKSGNGTWLSVELEGFAPDDGLHASHPGWESATAAQVEVCARLLARAHRDDGVPLQLATSPSGRGLGHHSMGAESGVDWGHSACPGSAIKAQKPAILARAVAITNGDDDMTPEQDERLKNVDTWLRSLIQLDSQVPLTNAGKTSAWPDKLGDAVKEIRANVAVLVARPSADPAALPAALAPLLVGATDEAAVLAVLRSAEGQAALVQAANTAEDS